MRLGDLNEASFTSFTAMQKTPRQIQCQPCLLDFFSGFYEHPKLSYGWETIAIYKRQSFLISQLSMLVVYEEMTKCSVSLAVMRC